MPEPLVVLLEIGKVQSRIALIDPQSGVEVHRCRHSHAPATGEHGSELDVAGIERWLIESLRVLPHKERVRVIVPVAHGSTAVLLNGDGAVMSAPDADDSRFDSTGGRYRRERDDYERTYSPCLPSGSNLGRQLFHLQYTQPELFSQVQHVLLYPQYWAWRLSGVMASETTSLGCHSDLWLPAETNFSSLARRCGWHDLLPVRRFAGDLLGPITTELAAATGLDTECQVTCGMHDIAASYLKFLVAGDRDEPFALICDSTATTVMVNRGDLGRLREERDMLAYVDAFGSPVASARFLGDVEYEAIAGTDARPNMPALINVVARRAMALPAFANGGPFAKRVGSFVNVDRLSGSERAAVATLYIALMTELLLESLDARGDIIVEGPLAANPLFGSLLATLISSQPVYLSIDGGHALAACYLAGFTNAPAPTLKAVSPVSIEQLREYRRSWRDAVMSAGEHH